MADHGSSSPPRTRARRRPSRRRAAVLAVVALLASTLVVLGPAGGVEGDSVDPEGGAPRATMNSATVIGWVSDFGYDHPDMVYLRDQIDDWEVDYVVSTGDNWQYRIWPGGHHGPEPTGTDRYDRVVGRWFCAYLRAEPGPFCHRSDQADPSRFFPVIGNHDHDDGPIENYDAYFGLPRYYDVRLGDVHVFAVNSEEPATFPAQKAWLQAALASSTAPWKIVALHQPVYGSSVYYGSNPILQWDYAAWGADVVINGHASLYERVHRDGIRYVTAGLGGGIGDDGVTQTGTCKPPGQREPGSQVCLGRGSTPYLHDDAELGGAVKIVATPAELSFEARTLQADGYHLLDSFSLSKPQPVISTTSLPAGQQASPYSATLQATGGTAPYTWERTGGAQLHPGLTLNASTGVISGTPTASGTRTIQFRATGANGVQSAPKSLSLTIDAAPPSPSGGAFVGMEPTRFLDTRTSGPCVSGPVGRHLTVAGTRGVPADATAVSLNVAVVNPTAPGFLTVHPTGTARTSASNLNYMAGQVVPNLVTARVGSGGQVTLYASGGCPHVVVDVTGYYTGGTPGPGGFVGITPTRLLDTRTSGPCVSGAGGRQLTVAPSSAVPAGATAVALNVAVVNPTAPGFLTVYPSGVSRPNASNLNYVAGQVVPNHVKVKLGTGGAITLYASGGCPHVVVDVAGYFTGGTPGPGGFVGITPTRVLDTRTSGPCVSGTGGREVTLAPTPPVVPADAAAVALNVAVVHPSSPGFLTVYPNGSPRPTASNLNYVAGQVVPNAALVKVGNGGKLRLYASGGCPHVVVDVVGYHEG